MEINLTQIFLNGVSTGIGAVFGTVATFLVMKYFPAFWNGMEGLVKKSMKHGVKSK